MSVSYATWTSLLAVSSLTDCSQARNSSARGAEGIHADRACAQHGIPVAARGSATASLVVWALGLSDLCPLDYDLDGRMFVHKGREDLPDLDLEVSSLHEQAVSAFVQQGGFEGLPAHGAGEFPHLRAIRVGVHVTGPEQVLLLGYQRSIWTNGLRCQSAL
jgi:hypothetical protein